MSRSRRRSAAARSEPVVELGLERILAALAGGALIGRAIHDRSQKK
jgi:hypothetical protein